MDDASLREALDRLLARPDAATLDLQVSVETDTEHHEALRESYHAAVSQLERRFGVPHYRGKGPRGHAGAPRLSVTGLHHGYNSALDVTWWRLPERVVGLMITGHDADTLQCLALTVSLRP